MSLNPKPASTVLICQENSPWPPKILLIKRSKSAAFLPNAHVFPGGQLDNLDYNHEKLLANTKLTERMYRYFPCDSALIAAHIHAAIRECQEEAGITIDEHRLWPLSWWVTPEGETRRFDTWFFLALTQSEHLDISSENSSPLWVRPKEALVLHQHQQIFLAPPTRAILERLQETNSLEHALSLVDQPLRPIHPFFVSNNQQRLLILPGHELHPDRIKSKFIIKTSYTF